MTEKPNVLIFCPAYNEEKTVGIVAKETKMLFPDFDFVVVNDGSIDNTDVEAEKADSKVVSLPFHSGGTTAVLTAYLIAINNGYDFIVKIDGDGQHKVDDIPTILEPVLSGDADISVGSRYLTNKNMEDDSYLKIGGRVFSSFILNRILKNVHITVTTSGFRAWNRKALKRLLNEYLNNRKIPDDSVLWLIETIISYKLGLKIKEVPIETLPRKYGKSKSFSPLNMFMYPFRLFRILIEALTAV